MDNALEMLNDAYLLIKEAFPECNHMSMFVDTEEGPMYRSVTLTNCQTLGRRDEDRQFIRLADRSLMYKNDGSIDFNFTKITEADNAEEAS